MSTLQLGLVLVTGESATTETARWTLLRDLAVRAEEIGLDTVWVIDELLWRQVEFMLEPQTMAALDAMASVIALGKDA